MRVLLVQSLSTPTGQSPVFPLGLCYLATSLADHNHQPSVFDTNISTSPLDDLKSKLHGNEPHVIGISLRNMDSSYYAVSQHFLEPFITVLDTVKKISPASKIIVGGPAFSIFGHTLMERLPKIDFGIPGEGEETLPDLLENLEDPRSVKGVYYRHNSSVEFTGTSELYNFASSLAPDHDFLDMEPYMKKPFSIGIQTKRGCLFNCSYCTYPYLQGRCLRLRSPGNVLDEIETLVRNYSCKSITFVDSIFNVPPEHTRELLEGMLERGINIRWRGYDELRYFNQEYFELARDSGCHDFDFSPDGISASTLRQLNKVTREVDIKRAFDIIKGSGNRDQIHASFSFFMNSPGDYLLNIFRLLIFKLRCTFILREKSSALHLLFIRVYPNTPIFDTAVKRGIFQATDDLIESRFFNPPPLKYLYNSIIITYKAIRSVYRIMKSIVRIPLTRVPKLKRGYAQGS